MPVAPRIRRRGESTRERILEAAAARFSACSDEQVGLRDIAVNVGVDVALVHRSYGSKERLFAAVLKGPLQAGLLLAAGDRRLSKLYPQAGRIIRGQLQEDFPDLLAARLDDAANQRPVLGTGCLLGIVIMRHVLQSEALTDAPRESILQLTARMLEICLGEMVAGTPSASNPEAQPFQGKFRARIDEAGQ